MELGIGLRIKNRRIELGLSQKELAHKMGYKSEAAISKVEHGEDNITSDRVSKFALALECSPGYLMGWDSSLDNAITTQPEIIDKALSLYRLYENASPGVRESVELLLKSSQ